MKKIKKMLAFTLTMVMVLGSMTIPAMAAPAEKGSITIKSPVLGAGYDAYKVFDMTMNEAGDAFSYSIKSTSPFYAAVEKYANADDSTDADGLTLTVSKDTENAPVKIYSVTPGESFDAQTFGQFLEKCIKAPDDDHPEVTDAEAIPPVYSQGTAVTTEDAESIAFNNLELGYYLILSTYPEYMRTTTLEYGTEGEEGHEKWTFTKNSTAAEIENAAKAYAAKVYPDLASAEAYVGAHGADFEKTWAQMTDDEKEQVWKDLKDSTAEDAVSKINKAVNKAAGDEADDNTLTNRLVTLDSTTPDAVVYEKNEVDKWDVPVNPDGSADLPDLPDHGEPKGGKNIIIGSSSDGEPVYADWTEANNGDDIHYQLRINAMNYVRTDPSNTTDTTNSIEQVKEYIIADYQSRALTYDPDQGIIVTIVDADGNVVGPKNAEGDIAAADYGAWSDYFFLNDEGDAPVAAPEGGILAGGGGIVIPWAGVTTDKESLSGNPNYTTSVQPKVDEEGHPVFVHEDVKVDEDGNKVTDADGNYVSVSDHIVDENGNLLDEEGNPVQDEETYYIYSLYPSDVTIVVDYHMILNDKAAIDGDGNINYSQYGMNYVDEDDYDYRPAAPNTKPDTPPDEPEDDREVDKATVYTFALAFKKVNDKGEALAGAAFELPFYVKKDADDDGAYIFAFTELPEDLTDADKAGYVNSLTTPESGEITIKGMAQGTYTFTETEAPAGYNKLAESFDVEAKKTGASATTTITRYLDENGKVTDEETDISVTYENEKVAVYEFNAVVNKQGTELPSTGGIGTTIFYVTGSILVICAGVVLVTRRRMAA